MCCAVQVIYKLTDFGYAKEYDNSSVCTSLVGTVQYVVRGEYCSLRLMKKNDFYM